MWEEANFLCEIGTEEIPAGYIPLAITATEKMIHAKFDEARIAYQECRVFATPRRIVICMTEVADMQRNEIVEVKGPAVDKAYDNAGKPTKALEGFLRGNGLKEEELEKVETSKGLYIYGKKESALCATTVILPEIITALIRELHFPKKMKWNVKKITYPRPIRYICVLFKDKLIPVEIDGIVAKNETRGHFIQSEGMLPVTSISGYEALLKEHHVCLDQTERKEKIKEQLEHAVANVKGEFVEDEALLDTVTFLVEDPHVVLCTFNPSFLDIPEIVLITEMREHQKYFAVKDNQGRLTNHFLVVANNPASSFIKEGNERVITARFEDANFFFKDDMKKPLASKVDSLKNVLFHKELGSVYDKMMRMQHIADIISTELHLDTAVTTKVTRAIELCKADLNTAMVYEFASLQGYIGKIYATLNGEGSEVADAIENHYRPRFQGDIIPEESVSIIVSLAEKIDNICGSFSVGNIPKGSQDPYALRRQAHAIVDLLLHNHLNLPLDAVITQAASLYQNSIDIKAVLNFIVGRAKTRFLDDDIRYDEIEACLATGNYDFYELYLRACSMHEFRDNSNFSQMLLGFKRMNNIFSGFMKKNNDYSLNFDSSLLTDEAEQKLYDFFNSKSSTIREYIKNNQYKELFSILIEGKPVIDMFFDDVMVMVDDHTLRDNRLALLQLILRPFASLIDFSKISE